MSWDEKKNGWINNATGDGVYIDKAVIEMILNDSFSDDKPMTLFIKSQNADFLKEMEGKTKSFGGDFIVEEDNPVDAIVETPQVLAPAFPASIPAIKKSIFTRLNIRDQYGCTTPEYSVKAYAELQDISGRWERRKKQLLIEYAHADFSNETIEAMLHREEILFMKNNACWITGEFPSNNKKIAEDKNDIESDEE